MDQTAKLWDLETGKEHSTLRGHEGEIVSLNFNADGDKILTGSFDGTAIVTMLAFRFGIPNLENLSTFYKATQARSQQHSFSSEDTCVVPHPSTKPAGFGT